jgi:hypothetical protein
MCVPETLPFSMCVPEGAAPSAKDGVLPRALADIPYDPARWTKHSSKLLDVVNNPGKGVAAVQVEHRLNPALHT